MGWELEVEIVDLPVTERILAVVLGKYGVTRSEVMGQSRRREVSRVRQLAMYLIAYYTGMSPRKVGEVFQRDRTTVAYACEKMLKTVQGSMAARKRFDELVAQVEQELGVAGVELKKGGEDAAPDELGEPPLDDAAGGLQRARRAVQLRR